MSTVSELFRRAVDLSEEECATLAGLLIESLESERDPDSQTAWTVEIERRLADLDSGIETVSWESVRGKLSRKVGEPSIEFHPLAELEVLEAHRWYAERSLFAAEAGFQPSIVRSVWFIETGVDEPQW